MTSDLDKQIEVTEDFSASPQLLKEQMDYYKWLLEALLDLALSLSNTDNLKDFLESALGYSENH